MLGKVVCCSDVGFLVYSENSLSHRWFFLTYVDFPDLNIYLKKNTCWFFLAISGKMLILLLFKLFQLYGKIWQTRTKNNEIFNNSLKKVIQIFKVI